VDNDVYLLHQVHPVKLATDIAADVTSCVLIWRGHTKSGLTAAFVPAAAASSLLLRRDLSPLRATRRGRYVLVHMPASAQAVRLAGQGLAWRAAHRHEMAGVVIGHLLIVAGWSFGLWMPRG
jgi:hypothetical protein